MNRNKTKPLVLGAALAAIYAVLGVVNLMLGTTFDIIFIYLMTIAYVLYSYVYGMKYAWVSLATSFFVLWMVGELYFLFMGTATSACAIHYGHNLKHDKKYLKPILLIELFTKNIIIFLALSALLGLGTFNEGFLEAQAYLPWIDTNVFVIGMIVILLMLAIGERAVIDMYSKIAMKKMNIGSN